MVSLAEAVIAFMGTLRLAGGDHDGELFEVLPWQRRAVRGILKRLEAAVSTGRGCGKTAFFALLACCVLDPAGPLHGRRREVVIVAPTFRQAMQAFEDVLASMGERHDLSDRAVWRKQETMNYALLEHRASGARVRCVSSRPGGLHGLRPFLLLVDEPAQFERGQRDRAWAAFETSLGKTPGAMVAYIGTTPGDPTDPWARKLASARYVQLHAASAEDDPLSDEAARKALPSWDHLPSLRAQVRRERAAAALDPAQLQAFKSLRLNMPITDDLQLALVDAEVWEAAEGDAAADGPYSLGVDPGSTEAHTGASAFWWRTGRLEVLAVVGDEPPLDVRGLQDGVGSLYVDMHAEGTLITAPGRVADIALLLREIRGRWGLPDAITSDRYRLGDLRDALDEEAWPKLPFMDRGMGWRDGTADVRAFRRALLSGRVEPVRSLGLRAALSGARLVGDTAGNLKLAKGVEGGRRLRHRDDIAAAAVLAVSSAALRQRERLRDARPLVVKRSPNGSTNGAMTAHVAPDPADLQLELFA